MQSDSLIEVTWHPRQSPLVPAAVAARGNVATRLAYRLLQAPDQLATFKGVGAPGLLVILGDEQSLPWVDQVCYLGRDPQSPSLLLPTNLAPSVPTALFERSIKSTHGPLGPCAVLLEPQAIIPLTEARTVSRESLLKWLETDL